MQSEVPDMKSLQERVCRLECQNRRLKQIGITVLVVIGCVVGMGQANSTKSIEAHEFLLRDNAGNVRAKLSMNENSHPEMVFLDEKGGTRIKLEGNNGAVFGGVVSVFDSNGQQRGILDAGKLGIGLTLLDSDGHPKTQLSPGGLWIDGGIRLEDQAGYAAWLGKTGLLYQGETQAASAASVILVDNPHGKVIWKAGK